MRVIPAPQARKKPHPVHPCAASRRRARCPHRAAAPQARNSPWQNVLACPASGGILFCRSREKYAKAALLVFSKLVPRHVLTLSRLVCRLSQKHTGEVFGTRRPSLCGEGTSASNDIGNAFSVLRMECRKNGSSRTPTPTTLFCFCVWKAQKTERRGRRSLRYFDSAARG